MKKRTSEELTIIFQNKNIQCLDNYVNNHTKVNFECLKCKYI